MTTTFSRRELACLALAGLPPPRPNSKFGGVQIGINAPYSFHGRPADADSVLKDLIELGLSGVELRSQPVEQFFGAPVALRGGPRLSPDQQAAQRASAEALQKWRLAAPMSQFKQFRRKYEDAGVRIGIVKFDGVDAMTDDVADYAFQFAKALGAHAISCEIPVSKTKWFGQFATRHKLMVGYHGHANITNPEAFGRPESWETAMEFSRYNGINLDIGHFIAGNNKSPIEFMMKYAGRITHVHLKDRKLANGPNTEWGRGDTPIRDVLRLMKKEKYPFQGTIEFEYKVPEGSDLMKEIGRCVDYCRAALS